MREPLVQAVGNVGHRSKRGRHTTRSAVLLDLPAGGLLVDTPGFNYPAMERVTPGNVQQFFPEIRRIKDTSACKFANCSHVHEPQCAVRDAQWERYPYYVRCAPLHRAPALQSWMCGLRCLQCAHVCVLDLGFAARPKHKACSRE